MNVHQSRAKTAQIVYTNGHISFSDYRVKVYLNPVERTLYTLFLNHPEGLRAQRQLADNGVEQFSDR